MGVVDNLRKLIAEGEKLAPLGGNLFGGYNGEKQPEYVSWRLQTIAAIEELGTAAKPLLKEIEELDKNQGGSFFYEHTASHILGVLRAALAIAKKQFVPIEPAKLTQVKEKKPLIFISYASDEVEFADFIKKVLLRLSAGKIDVFIAKRDISSGDNPLKVMLDDKLKSADAIIPICSLKAKQTSWVWWETAAVWAKTGNVYPLFLNISPRTFGEPLILVAQGKEFFIKNEFFETLRAVYKAFDISPIDIDFVENENREYIEMEKRYSKNLEPAHVKLSYDISKQSQDFHRYSLNFEIENKTQVAFDDVVLELLFPEKYLETKEWKYPHLHSSIPRNMPEYLCLTFEFSNMPVTATKQFSADLLPGKTLKIFGKEGITILQYSVDHERWEDIRKYEISWKLYLNKGFPQKDNVPFHTLQRF